MKRRTFCKTTASILLAWGINPINAFANTNNQVLLGQLFINKKLVKDSFDNLDNALMETQNSRTIVKVDNDVFLIRANSKLRFHLNKINEVIKGSLHGVFGKREKELLIKIPNGTLGIRGTAIYLELDTQKQRSALCNCYGHTVVYGNSGKLLKSLNNTKKDMHSVVTITDENVLASSKFKHEVVGKNFL